MLSSRAFYSVKSAASWEELWEAGPYYDRISELLEDASHYAVFVGWQIDSRLALKKPVRNTPFNNIAAPIDVGTDTSENKQSLTESLIDKVVRLCREKPDFHVYFLFWDHAYLYVLERQFWQARIWDDIHDRVHFVFDNRHPWGACHHEKICIFDGKVALCGGIDLCDQRWDSPQHLYWDPRRSLSKTQECHGPYHDLAVQVSGSICADLQEHIQKRWGAISSIPFPKARQYRSLADDSSAYQIYVSRTFCEVDSYPKRFNTVREIEFLFRDLVFSAERRIILEGQYYWSEVFNDILISKIQQMAGKKFEVVLILAELQNIKSLTRFMTSYELSLLRQLQVAANYAGVKLVMGAPFSLPASSDEELPPRPIYIHSKVIIIDDRYFGVGSANFATRALRVDTEVQLTLEAKNARQRLHIQRVADHILRHWKIDHKNSIDILTRSYYPRIELKHLRKNLRWTLSFPCHIFFDPTVPWFASLKQNYQRLLTRHTSFLILKLLQPLLSGIILSWLIVGTKNPSTFGWVSFYCGLMSATWQVPIAFSGASLLAILQLGHHIAAKISILALWVASFVGYILARAYPSLIARWCFYDRFLILYRQFGLRTFSHFLKGLFDPRVSVQSKILGQGLYCIPLPWFVFGMGVIFPALLYFMIFWILDPMIRWMPNLIVQSARDKAGFFLIFIAMMSIRKSVIFKWRMRN